MLTEVHFGCNLWIMLCFYHFLGPPLVSTGLYVRITFLYTHPQWLPSAPIVKVGDHVNLVI